MSDPFPERTAAKRRRAAPFFGGLLSAGRGDGPPDLDELWRDFNRKLNGLFGGKHGAPRGPATGGDGPSLPPDLRSAGIGLGLIAGVVALIWLGSGVFIVQAGQQAVVTSFGKYTKTVDAGLQWRMPYPFQAHETVNFTQLRTVEVGRNAVIATTGLRDSSMLTQDENIVDIRFTVQYRLKDARAFLFENQNPESAVTLAAESAVREIVGKSRIDSVLYEQRDAIAAQLAKSVQDQLDRLKAGILIVNVNVQSVQPPEQVQAAFEDTLKAGQDGDRAKKEALAYASDVIPKAKGQAARMHEEAEGYKARIVAEAEGNAQRFDSVLTEYQKAPTVTRDRLYIDTMQQIYSNVSKVLIDSRSGSNLVSLPLDRLMQQAAVASAPVAAAPAAAGDAPVTTTVPAAGDARSRDNQRGRDREAGDPGAPDDEDETMNRIVLAAGGVLLALVLIASTLFVVDQRQVGVVYALGEIKEVIQEPGLHWKLPPPFQNVVFLDRRIQTMDSPETRPIFTAEKKSLVIDWLVKWRITDPRQFILNNGPDMHSLETRLSPIVHAAFNEEVTKRNVGEVLSTGRDRVMQDVRGRLADEARAFGIDILDVRIKRVDFVANITDSIYNRMAAERKQVANQLRATGFAEGEKIKADAERQRDVIVASAFAEAQKLRGEGDARASAIFADAFGRDPQFAKFYRSLEAYRAAFRNRSDLIVADPASDFFQSMRGGPLGAPSAAGKK